MTDHNTMTIDQCRDEIAEKVLGWHFDNDVVPRWIKGTEYQILHPAGPPTTDAALAAMPKEWEYEVHNRNVGGLISARAIPSTGHWDEAIDAHGETEALCRWRLCVVAWRKEKGVQ